MERVAQILWLTSEEGVSTAGAMVAVVSSAGPSPELGYESGADGRVIIGLHPGLAVLDVWLCNGSRQRITIEASPAPMTIHLVRMRNGSGWGRRVRESEELRARRLLTIAARLQPADASERLEDEGSSAPPVEILLRECLESTGTPTGAAEALARDLAKRGQELIDKARANALRHDDLRQQDLIALESVISTVRRPAWFVLNDHPDTRGALLPDRFWLPHINRQFRTISEACQCVGAVIRIDGSVDTSVGTGWMVGERLLLTNAHVALHLFRERLTGLTGPTDGWSARPGIAGAVDLGLERSPRPARRYPITGYRYIETDHEMPDLALLTIGSNEGGDPPAALLPDLSRPASEIVAGTLIFAIGHPQDVSGEDSGAHTVFGRVDGTKRFSPGEAKGRLDDFVLAHDCSTLGGSSGSPLLDFSSGKAIGLHYWGRPGDRNEAVLLPAISQHPALAGLEKGG